VVARAENHRAAFAGCAEVACSCVAPEPAPAAQAGLSPPATRRPRVAVLAVGVRMRFYPATTLRHVVGAATRQGYDVDYFAMLNWNRARHQSKKIWSKGELGDGRGNPLWANVTKLAMQDHVARLARRHGARRVQLHLVEPAVTAEVPLETTRLLGRENRQHPALVNYLLKLKKVEMLWNRTLGANDGVSPYSHVVLVRDDVHWLDDIRLADFPDPHAVYSMPLGFLCDRPHLRDHPAEHVFVIGGAVADRLLRAYREYFENPSPELNSVDSTEQYWQVLAWLLGIRWELVLRNRLPYLLSMHRNVGNSTVFCIRGISQATLRRPTASCVHPSLIRHPTCADL